MRQAAMPFARPPEPVAVAEGDIWQLGRHRLMCGDATDKDAVARLFDGRQPTLVVTSPPYAKQRAYDRPIPCWDSMMMGALDGHKVAEKAQLLVNLGGYVYQGNFLPYWNPWLSLMRQRGWQWCGQYVWDKLAPQPGECHGFCYHEHEFIFHLRTAKVQMNKIIPNKRAGAASNGSGYRRKSGVGRKKPAHKIGEKRPMGSVIRLYPEKCNQTGHPAVYPVGLPATLIAAWKRQNCLTYDPFLGSGTSILAAEAEGVDGLGMEISGAYCQIAIDRWNKTHPTQAASLVSRA